MKANLLILLFSLCLSFHSFAMLDDEYDDGSESNHSSPQTIQSMKREPTDASEFEGCPKEIKVMILHRATIGECLNNRSPVNILLVCREWRKLIEEGSIDGKTVKKLCQEAWYGVPGHE
ncbi:MAG TPA: hypothetical protein VK625_13180, partial [Flavitalea sp.]|nr:hypothetical protein [Flavitalea sp.]